MNVVLNDITLLNSKCFINGAWRDTADGSTFTIDNPADGSIVAQVADCSTA